MSQRPGVALLAVLIAGCVYLGVGSSPEPSPESTSPLDGIELEELIKKVRDLTTGLARDVFRQEIVGRA